MNYRIVHLLAVHELFTFVTLCITFVCWGKVISFCRGVYRTTQNTNQFCVSFNIHHIEAYFKWNLHICMQPWQLFVQTELGGTVGSTPLFSRAVLSSNSAKKEPAIWMRAFPLFLLTPSRKTRAQYIELVQDLFFDIFRYWHISYFPTLDGWGFVCVILAH